MSGVSMIKGRAARVLSAVTVSDSVIFFYGMPSFLSARGVEVAISAADGPELDIILERENPIVYRVDMEREISIFKDIWSLFHVLKVLYRFKPDIVNAGTPKAGLLYMIGAWLFRVPLRIYHVRGLRHESLDGLAEKLQVYIERICGGLATHIVCETQSLKDLAIEQGLYRDSKCYVLGPGSSGVELSNYSPDGFSAGFRKKFREELGIPIDAEVIGFLGRVVPRKGITELLEAWSKIREKYPSTYLLIAGPLEDAQPLKAFEIETIQKDPRIIFTGKVEGAAKYYSVMDIFTLPAHWEGFGNVLVEAASMGLPVVTTNGTGTRDAAEDGYNSLVIPVKDSTALVASISKYLDDKLLRSEHGRNGREWASRFERKVILRHLSEFYESLLR
jgi:glycosyltransferase involved in cell wall biosynthesis